MKPTQTVIVNSIDSPATRNTNLRDRRPQHVHRANGQHHHLLVVAVFIFYFIIHFSGEITSSSFYHAMQFVISGRVCKIKHNSIVSGFVSCSKKNNIGSVCGFACNNGNKLVGSGFLTCSKGIRYKNMIRSNWIQLPWNFLSFFSGKSAVGSCSSFLPSRKM